MDTVGVLKRVVRVVAALVGGAVILASWVPAEIRLVRLLVRSEYAYDALPWVSALTGLAFVVLLGSVARRWHWTREAVTFALLASLPLLPCLHSWVPEWLSDTRVGHWTDYIGRLSPRDFYPISPIQRDDWRTFLPRPETLLLLTVAVVTGGLTLAFRRAQVRRSVTLAVIGTVALLVGLAGVRLLTRPSLACWPSAYPEIARIPISSVAPCAMVADPTVPTGERCDPITRLPEHVRVGYRPGVLDDGSKDLNVSALPFHNAEGDPRPAILGLNSCRPDAVLVLHRVLEAPDHLLLQCDNASGETRAPFERRRYGNDIIEVRGWDFRLLSVDVLRHSAMPPSWFVVALFGLALAAAIHRRRPDHAHESNHAHPYRSSLHTPAPIEDVAPLRHAVAIAATVHAAAPILLTLWIQGVR